MIKTSKRPNVLNARYRKVESEVRLIRSATTYIRHTSTLHATQDGRRTRDVWGSLKRDVGRPVFFGFLEVEPFAIFLVVFNNSVFSLETLLASTLYYTLQTAF